METAIAALCVCAVVSLAAFAAGLALRPAQAESAARARSLEGPGATGAQTAVSMLDAVGCSAAVVRHAGADCFDVDAARVMLSTDTHDGVSAASLALACHEAGHAVQAVKRPAMARAARIAHVLPPVLFSLWAAAAAAGCLLQLPVLAAGSCALYALACVCGLASCAPEADASHRALEHLRGAGLEGEALRAASGMLRLAIVTYAAAAFDPLGLLVSALSGGWRG